MDVSFSTTVRQFVFVAGEIQAISVIPVVKSSDAESGTVTRALLPLNDNALPNLPAVVHVAPTSVPVFPVPDRSAVAVPAPSLNE